MITTATISAPAGWGFIPGTIIAGLSANQLPDIEFPPTLKPATRNTVIVDLLRAQRPLLAVLAPRDLVRKYALAQVTASTILTRARAA